jgi:hypothetical protein
MNALFQPENAAPGTPAALRFANGRKAVIMNLSDRRKGGKFSPMKKYLNLILIIFTLAFTARAQDDVPPPLTAPMFSSAQLDQLAGPIALYPDPLIAVMLPAATLPSEIVMADRYVSNGGDPNQMDPQTYDQNVIALAHYPDVLKWMDDNLNWTTQLGQAFQGQQQDVMDSVQRLRTQAYNLGNLQSTSQQQVVNDNGYIEILPANPDDIYVPSYQPAQVYYVEPSGPPFITFSVGFIIGPWLCGDFDWHHHQVVYWDRYHPRPQNWWHEAPNQRQVYLAGGHANVWNPNNRPNPSGFHGGDRGWNAPENHNAPVVNHGAPVPNHGGNNPGNPHLAAPIPNRPAPQPTEHYVPNENRNDAFIGSDNARDTRTYSNRGAQSTGTESHASPGGGSVHSSGGNSGGGGFHGSTGGGGAGGGSHGSGGGSSSGGGGNGRH